MTAHAMIAIGIGDTATPPIRICASSIRIRCSKFNSTESCEAAQVNFQAKIRIIVLLAVFSVTLCFVALFAGAPPKGAYSILAAVVTVAGYAVYIAKMYPPVGGDAAQPDPLVWFLFFTWSGIGAIEQLSQGGGVGTLCLFVTALGSLVISLWSYFRWKDQQEFGVVYAIVAIVTVVTASAIFYASVVAAREPRTATQAAILAAVADLLSYSPAVYRAWLRPRNDSITNYFLNAAKCIPALAALERWTIATTFYLFMLLCANSAFCLYLVLLRNRSRFRALRRCAVKKNVR